MMLTILLILNLLTTTANLYIFYLVYKNKVSSILTLLITLISYFLSIGVNIEAIFTKAENEYQLNTLSNIVNYNNTIFTINLLISITTLIITMIRKITEAVKTKK
ncbi:MAG: hypothetical protein QXQ14_03685 [Candidatus Aenigmatarchaeota archaeon]